MGRKPNRAKGIQVYSYATLTFAKFKKTEQTESHLAHIAVGYFFFLLWPFICLKSRLYELCRASLLAGTRNVPSQVSPF